ncbi:MAG: hypothetical protein LBT23_04170 [Synergistaceae bacterium]|jgi:threonine/homoserine/homoserine lactone efflux protein|nr:hypothetical protein [Synergistaceae bacterium]
MNVETSITVKRIATLICSMTVIVFFGYALGGVGGYLMGRGQPRTIAWGLAGGSLLAYMAIRIWRSYLKDVESAEQGREDGGSPPEAR